MSEEEIILPEAVTLLMDSKISTKQISLEKQSTAEPGYFATYVIKQGGTALSPKINIPKDYLVKSASVGTCTTANKPVSGYKVGDKYLDFIINTKDSSGSDEHLYVNVSDLIDIYAADNSTIELYTDNGTSKFRIKDSGVTTGKIKDANVTLAKLNTDVYDSTNGGTSGSSKLITSGAVYNGLSGKVGTDDERLIDARTPKPHTHGNIENDGIIKISGTAQASKNVVTDGYGKITTENKITKVSELTNDSGYTTATGHNHDGTYIKTGTGTVTSTNIADKTIVNGDIADTTITGGKLVNGTVTATQLASDSVEEAKIKDDAVTTGKIKDSNVTLAKLNSNVYDSTSGGTSGSSKLITSGAVYSGLSGKASSTHTHTGTDLKLGSSGTDANVTIQDAVNGKSSTDHNHDGTYLKTGTGTVTSTNILDKTIVNGDIADSTIELGKLKASSVIDSTSGGTSSSSKLITSGAVYSGLSGKASSTHTHSGTELKLGSSGSDANVSIQEAVNSKSASTHTHTGTELKLGSSGSDANVSIQEAVNNKASSTHNHDGTYIKTGTGTVTSTNIADKTIVNGDIADSTIELGKLNSTSVIDSTSGGTSGSSKLITSGAVYSGLSGKAASNHTHNDVSTVQTLTLLNTDAFSGTIKAMKKNGWVILSIQGFQSSVSTTTDYTEIAGLPWANQMGTAIYMFSDLNGYPPAVTMRVSGSRKILEGRIQTANKAVYGHIIYPTAD